jgi:phosphate-selective porin OprO/OprP
MLKKQILLLLIGCCCVFSINAKYSQTPSYTKGGYTNYTKDDAIKIPDSLPVKVTYSHGLVFTTKNDLFDATISSYLQADFMKFTGNTRPLLHSGANFRRAVVSLGGTILHDWTYYMNYDFALHNLQYAYVGYEGWKNMSLIIGQFTPDVSLSNYAENTALSFLELPLPIFTFTPYFNQGVAYTIYNKMLSANASIFGSGTPDTVTGHSPLGGSARLIFSPIHTETRVIHLGISDWFQHPDGSNSAVFFTTPEAMNHNWDTLINATINYIKNYNTIFLESAYEDGPWEIQAEYVKNHVKRRQPGYKDLDFGGYYITTSYFLTGESRVYSFPAGGFVGITPVRKKYGAWQILARFSTVNLINHDIRGGREKNGTLGLSWYVNNYVKFGAIYIRAYANPASDGKKRHVNVFALRAQVQM